MLSIRSFLRLFLYAGLEKDEFDSLRPRLREENKALLNVFSQLAAVMFLLLFIVSMLSAGFATVNSSTYLVSGIMMLLILLCVHCFAPKYPVLVTVLVYVFEIVLYVFAIRISMLHADKPAVSAIAFMLVSPLLFYDRPSRLSALIAAVVAAFCVIVARFKQPEVAETDIWNMITFGVVAAATTVFIMSIKVRALAQAVQIEYLSRTDLLTGLNNRNYYERRLQDYPGMCDSKLICVYGDVNGLHEMNNRQGHAAGDRMLREVAEIMRESFGAEHSYRVGGDEFVAFRADDEPARVSDEVARIRQELDGKGYHVSFGMAVLDKTQGPADMAALVREAENNMFIAKRNFYSQPGNNRRNR